MKTLVTSQVVEMTCLTSQVAGPGLSQLGESSMLGDSRGRPSSKDGALQKRRTWREMFPDRPPEINCLRLAG